MSDAAELRYPVLDSAELQPVRPRRMRRPIRNLTDLPVQPAGTALVFQMANGYDTIGGRALAADDPTVVEAVAVAVVDMRRTVVEAEAQMITFDPKVIIRIRGRFDCLVNDPLLVVETGCWRIHPWLGEHLTRDERVAMMATQADVTRYWAVFQRNLYARLRAYHDLNPYVNPGMEVRLMDVAVELQRVVTAPAARQPADDFPGEHRDGSPFDMDDDAPITGDGNPEFVPDDYPWGDDNG